MHNVSELSDVLFNQESAGDSTTVDIDGVSLVVYKDDTTVRIYPKDSSLHSSYEFSATITLDGYVEMSIQAKDSSGNRLPGFYAKEFASLAISYLQQRNAIRGIKGVWRRNTGISDNFKTFSLHWFQKRDGVEAAKQTWTGKLALSLGYSHVHISTEDPSYIHAYFSAE